MIIKSIWASILYVLLSSLSSVAANAQDASPPHQGLTQDQQDRLQFIQERGIELLERDDAAWVATDQMLADFDNNPQSANISGWVTSKLEDGTYRVTFVASDEDKLTAAHISIVKGREILSTEVYPAAAYRPDLSDNEISMFRARKIAFKAIEDEQRCTRQLNTAVIETPDGFDVYVLAPESENNTVSIGRHYRVPVSRDGKAGPFEKFSNSCLMLDTKTSDGNSLVGLSVTHLLDDIPAETHVFKSLRHQTPIYVMTTQNRLLWSVEGANIQLIQQDLE